MAIPLIGPKTCLVSALAALLWGLSWTLVTLAHTLRVGDASDLSEGAEPSVYVQNTVSHYSDVTRLTDLHDLTSCIGSGVCNNMCVPRNTECIALEDLTYWDSQLWTQLDAASGRNETTFVNFDACCLVEFVNHKDVYASSLVNIDAGCLAETVSLEDVCALAFLHIDTCCLAEIVNPEDIFAPSFVNIDAGCWAEIVNPEDVFAPSFVNIDACCLAEIVNPDDIYASKLVNIDACCLAEIVNPDDIYASKFVNIDAGCLAETVNPEDVRALAFVNVDACCLAEIVNPEDVLAPSSVSVDAGCLVEIVNPEDPCAISSVHIDDGWIWKLVSTYLLGSFYMQAATTLAWSKVVALSLHFVLSTCWTCLSGVAQCYLPHSQWTIGSPGTRRSQRSDRSRARVRVLYPPGEKHKDSCFFASLARCVLGRPPTVAEALRFRQVIAIMWRSAAPSVLHCTSRQAGFRLPEDYITALQGDLWGGVPDLLLMSQALALPISVLAEDAQHTMGSGGPVLELKQKHFSVTHCSSRTQWAILRKVIRMSDSKLDNFLQRRANRSGTPNWYHVRKLTGSTLPGSTRGGMIDGDQTTTSGKCLLDESQQVLNWEHVQPLPGGEHVYPDELEDDYLPVNWAEHEPLEDRRRFATDDFRIRAALLEPDLPMGRTTRAAKPTPAEITPDMLHWGPCLLDGTWHACLNSDNLPELHEQFEMADDEAPASLPCDWHATALWDHRRLLVEPVLTAIGQDLAARWPTTRVWRQIPSTPIFAADSDNQLEIATHTCLLDNSKHEYILEDHMIELDELYEATENFGATFHAPVDWHELAFALDQETTQRELRSLFEFAWTALPSMRQWKQHHRTPILRGGHAWTTALSGSYSNGVVHAANLRGGHPLAWNALAQQLLDERAQREAEREAEQRQWQEEQAALPQRLHTHWMFTTHLLRVRREGYEHAMPVLLQMLSYATLSSTTFVVENRRGLLHFFDDGVFELRPRITILAMPDVPGSREIVYDAIIRVVWTMGVKLLQLSLRALSGRAAARSYTSQFSTSWMARTSHYVAVVDSSRAALYILFPEPRPSLTERGGFKICEKTSLGEIVSHKDTYASSFVNIDACCLVETANPDDAYATTLVNIDDGCLVETVNPEDVCGLALLSMTACCLEEIADPENVFAPSSVNIAAGCLQWLWLCAQALFHTRGDLSVVGSFDMSLDCRGGAAKRMWDHDDKVLPPGSKRLRTQRLTIDIVGSFTPPMVVFVDNALSKEEILNLIPQHLCMHPSWMTVRSHFHTAFVHFINPVAPDENWSLWENLASRMLNNKRSLFFGYRATRQAGTSVATDKHEPEIAQLNEWARSWLPDTFRWNAVAVVRHAYVEDHVDGNNSSQSIVLTLTADRTFLKVRSPLTKKEVRVNVARRPAWFNPRVSHAAEADKKCLTVVFYHTRRMVRAEHSARLEALGFQPLNATPPAAQLSDSSLSLSGSNGASKQPSNVGDAGQTVVTSQRQRFSASEPCSADSSDCAPLTTLLERGHDPPTQRTRSISPTLPFLDERGGAPKSMDKGARRQTWEGSSPSLHLTIQSPIFDSTGARLPQIHISELCLNATGVALVNWSSWAALANTTSTSTLLAMLPGHRTFELNPPPEAKVHRVDVVINEPDTAKRFPRKVTVVELGTKAPTFEQPMDQHQVPAASAPFELVLEVDARAFEDADARQTVKAFVDDTVLENAAHNKLYGTRQTSRDEYPLLFVAKIRVSKDHAILLLAASGDRGVFVRPTSTSQEALPEMALIWLSADAMEAKPLVFLRNTRRQLGTSFGLCRSHKLFGIRAEPRLAGTTRATLGVARAHQFAWNEHLVPTHKFLVRGTPAELSDVELAELIHQAFKWAHVPLRRTKATQNGAAVWIVGASTSPKTTHARVGTNLITVEDFVESRDKRGQPKNQGKKWENRKHTSSESRTWRTEPDAWDPWGKAATATQMQWHKAGEQPETHHADPWRKYQTPAASTHSVDKTKLDALEQRMDKMERTSTDVQTKVLAVDTRLGKVELDVNGLAGQMQANFDKLFATFESKNAEGDFARKSQRTDDSRGGTRPLVQEIPFSDLHPGQDTFQVAFCNTSTHKGHLDRLLDVNKAFDLLVMAETNHVPADVKPHRYIPLQDGGFEKVHLAWTPPLRRPGDHQTKGRSSSGVLMASRSFLLEHPFMDHTIADL
eukprot:1019102-Amphidinium_carterae.1